MLRPMPRLPRLSWRWSGVAARLPRSWWRWSEVAARLSRSWRRWSEVAARLPRSWRRWSGALPLAALLIAATCNLPRWGQEAAAPQASSGEELVTPRGELLTPPVAPSEASLSEGAPIDAPPDATP